jgi:hypothetical protein
MTYLQPIYLLLVIILLVFTSESLAADENTNDNWSIELYTGSSDGYFEPDEIIQFTIPDADFADLLIELDAIDISEMVAVEDGIASYQPIRPLETGEHQLRVVEYRADGEIIEHGSWFFEVRLADDTEVYGFAADTQLSVNYRIDDKNIGEPAPNKSQSEAYSQLSFSTSRGHWTAEGQFDLYYTSLKANRPSERTIDNGEFLFSVGNPYFNAKIGHQSVGDTSLVMDSFHRRGISLEGHLPAINSRLTGFSLSSIDITGFGQGLGITDSQQRVDGYSVTTTLFEEEPELLNITATWLRAAGDDSGALIYNFDELASIANKGYAQSLQAESLLLENRLKLKAEFASSEFDYNPVDTLPAEKDHAHDILLTFNDITESGISWNVGVNQQQIGTFFHSLANQGLPTDRQVQKLYGGAQWSTIGIQAHLEQQQDNIEEIEELPQISTDISSLNLSWSPAVTSNDNWYGTPSFSAGVSNQKQQQTYTPTDYFFAEADNELQVLQLSSSFSYPTSSWGLSIMNTDFVDHSQVQNDTDTLSAELFSDFQIAEGFNLSPSIRFDRTTDLIQDIAATSVTYSLQSVFVFEPEKLDGSVSVIYSDNQSSDLFTDDKNVYLNLALNWRLREPARNSFGAELVIGGTYNDFTDRFDILNSLENYQVFINLTLLMPNRAGQAE